MSDTHDPNQSLELNSLIAESAHAFTDLQCHVRYSLNELREMVKDDNTSRADILHCIDEYEAQIKCRVLATCSRKKAVFKKLQTILNGLIPPPIQDYVTALKEIYGGVAGWK